MTTLNRWISAGRSNGRVVEQIRFPRARSRAHTPTMRSMQSRSQRRLEPSGERTGPKSRWDDRKLISEQLGHASVQINARSLRAPAAASYDSAGERLDAALFGAGLQASASSGPETNDHAVPPAGLGEDVSAVVMPLSAAGGGTA